jgi:hypothetical protein
VDNHNSLPRGGLANKPQFFGDNTTETISVMLSSYGYAGWNGAWTYSLYSGNQWPYVGGRSNDSHGAGVFAFTAFSGSISQHISHRTILSGY